jgi:hypothetical protein
MNVHPEDDRKHMSGTIIRAFCFHTEGQKRHMQVEKLSEEIRQQQTAPLVISREQLETLHPLLTQTTTCQSVTVGLEE